jgi:hypothetical protein
MRHGLAMSEARSLLTAVVACLAAAACSSNSSSSAAPDAGYCQSNGYAVPTGSSCPKGTCMASGTSVPCCGSVCASCEAKGLVSYDSAGMCPAGLCPSPDVTATLACCDSVPSVLTDGTYCEPSMSDAGASEAGQAEASVDSGAPEASGD